MKFRLNSVAVALRFAIPGAVALFLVAVGVSAQTPAPAKGRKIEITGSNIKRVDAESAANGSGHHQRNREKRHGPRSQR